MDNIHFGANFIGRVSVKKKNIMGRFKTEKVSLLCIDTLNKDDIQALKHTRETWKDLTIHIYEDANMFYQNKERSKFHHIFALSEQNDNFEKLQPEKILAESAISAYPTSKSISIDYFQVHPKHNYFAKDRQFKKVGEAMLNAIKKIFEDREILLHAVPKSTDFYAKNDFHPVYYDSYNMRYSKGEK